MSVTLILCTDSGCVCVLESPSLRGQWEKKVWSLRHHVFIFKVVHGYYQIKIKVYPQLFFHTGLQTGLLSNLLPPAIPFPTFTGILKAVVFSVMLIDAGLSVHFNCGVKRLHPERVIACALLFLRNELIQSVHFHCAQIAKYSGI